MTVKIAQVVSILGDTYSIHAPDNEWIDSSGESHVIAEIKYLDENDSRFFGVKVLFEDKSWLVVPQVVEIYMEKQ